jgi:hypothetical protein
MATIRSFATPHKGLRNALGQFSLRLGHTDFSDSEQLAALKRLGGELFTLLNDHVHTENEHTLRHLEERAPGAGDHDRDDHERLEGVQHELQERLERCNGTESAEFAHIFYLDFSRFHSIYLEHICEEETVTEQLLQTHFSDEELITHRNAIMQRLDFPVLLLWLKYVIPAQQDTENAAMLSGLKANAPQEAFDAVLETIRPELTTERFERLMSVR